MYLLMYSLVSMCLMSLMLMSRSFVRSVLLSMGNELNKFFSFPVFFLISVSFPLLLVLIPLNPLFLNSVILIILLFNVCVYVF